MTHATRAARRRRRVAAALLAAGTVVGGLSLTATADRSWNPAVTFGSWSVPANWLGGVVPVSTDNVFIDVNSASGCTVVQDANFNSTLGLRVQNRGSSVAELLCGGLTLQVGSFDIGAGGRGLAYQWAGSISTGNQLVLGSGATGTGTFLLEGGQLYVGGLEQVGYAGAGVFRQFGGTHTIGTAGSDSNQLRMAETVGSRGTYLLSGTSTLNVSGHGFVGMAGLATFGHSGGIHNVGTTSRARNLSLARYVEGSGRYLLSGGTLNVSGSEWMGEYGAGTFDQSGGIHNIGTSGTGELNIGRFSGATGTYLLRGGTLNVNGNEYLGYQGRGTFTQSGGRNNVEYGYSLVLGGTSSGVGYYGLGNGTLTVQGPTVIGPSGVGTFVQSGGSHSNLYMNVSKGSYALSGVTSTLSSTYYQSVGGAFPETRFDQSGGTNTMYEYLTIAPAAGNVGTYTLSGGTLNVTGALHDGAVYVGSAGAGSFIQSGGLHAITSYAGTLPGSMAVGYGTSGVGRYVMQGGTLTTNRAVFLGLSGAGTFTQSAGTVNVGAGTTADLHLGFNPCGVGTYLLGGSGVLNVTGNEYVGSGGTGTIQGGRGLFSQSGGTNTIGTVAAPKNLYVGWNVHAGGSTYVLGGGMLNVRGDEYIGVLGNGGVDQSGGINTVGGDLYFGYDDAAGYPAASGSYVLTASGVLNVAGDEFVGHEGNGSFTQSGGTHSIGGNLYFGYATNPYSNAGRYSLGGTGMLDVAGSEYIGYADNGINTFDQSGGTHSVGAKLHVGYGGQGVGGRYALSGTGALAVRDDEFVGYQGGGVFDQSGGTHAVGTATSRAELYVGVGEYGTATYLLSGNGVLNVSGSEILGHAGATGVFNQSGGTHTIGGPSLHLSTTSDAVGRFLLSGGVLNVNGVVFVGGNGLGTFVQSAGNHTITPAAADCLWLGYASGAAGTYVLEGGTLNANGTVDVGHRGTGNFNQSGGTHRIAGSLYLGSEVGTGTYLLSGNAALHVNGWGDGMGVGVGGEVATPGGTGVVSIAGGTASIQGTMKVWSAGTVNYTGGRLSAGTLDIAAGGQVLLGAGSGVLLKTNALAIADTGKLDLADNHMILDYGGDHWPPLNLVRSYIAEGYDGGLWTGDRITTCEGDSTCGLGYAGSWSIFSTFPATFEGYSVDDTAVLIAHTRYGDANLDGIVNLTDFNRLASNFGMSGRYWFEGDFNYDGIVNLQDFNRLAANFGLSAGADGVVDPQDWAALAAAVPEPAGVATAACAAAMTARLLRRRRAATLASTGEWRCPVPAVNASRGRTGRDRCRRIHRRGEC